MKETIYWILLGRVQELQIFIDEIQISIDSAINYLKERIHDARYERYRRQAR